MVELPEQIAVAVDVTETLGAEFMVIVLVEVEVGHPVVAGIELVTV